MPKPQTQAQLEARRANIAKALAVRAAKISTRKRTLEKEIAQLLEAYPITPIQPSKSVSILEVIEAGVVVPGSLVDMEQLKLLESGSCISFPGHMSQNNRMKLYRQYKKLVPRIATVHSEDGEYFYICPTDQPQ